MGPIRNQSNEFDLNADFIEFPPDSDSDLEEDASSIQFDKETIVKLLSLRGAYAGINDQPVVTDDEFAMALDYIPFVQEHTMPIREDTINQPAPDYIPVEEYDEDMCVISDSEDEHMEDEIIHLSSDSEPEDRNMGDGDVIEISSDEEEYAPSWARNAEFQSSDRKCQQCHIQENISNRLSCMKLYKTRLLCKGCQRLFDCCASNEEISDMIKWFATGKWPEYDKPDKTFDSLRRFQIRSRQLFSRSVTISRGLVQVPLFSAADLMKLYIKSNGLCQISKLPLHFHNNRKNRLPYWALSFDHIIPLSTAPKKISTHSVSNLQIMCSSLNTVKGHYSDDELIQWYRGFIKSIKVVID